MAGQVTAPPGLPPPLSSTHIISISSDHLISCRKLSNRGQSVCRGWGGGGPPSHPGVVLFGGLLCIRSPRPAPFLILRAAPLHTSSTPAGPSSRRTGSLGPHGPRNTFLGTQESRLSPSPRLAAFLFGEFALDCHVQTPLERLSRRVSSSVMRSRRVYI